MTTRLGRQFHETNMRQVPPPAEELSVRPALPVDSAFIQELNASFDLNDAKSLHLVGSIGGRRVGLLSLHEEEDGSLAISVHVGPTEPDSGIGNRMLLQAAEKMRYSRLSAAGWRDGFKKLGAAPKSTGYKR